MFSLSLLPGILPGQVADVATVEISDRTLAGGPRMGSAGPGEAQSSISERTMVSMKKEKIKPQSEPTSAEMGEQSLELLLLYEQYKRPIHSYVYRLLGNQEDADDLTQEVFLRAFLSWDHLYDRQHLSAWLYRIATNLCVDQLRRRKRISWWPLMKRAREETGASRGDEDEATYLPVDTGGIPEVFEREHIRLALASLPEDYAIALVLSAAQGVPYQDIAHILGISPRAAATRISRAKRLFAKNYQRLSEEDTGSQEG